MGIYLEIEQHPAGYWFYITDEQPGAEIQLLEMNGPYPSEAEANNAGEQSLNRNIQSAA